MTSHENQVGLRLRADSTSEGAFRVSRTSALVIADGHSRWYEQGSRGQIYSVTTALAGTTTVPNNAAPPAAGVATVLSVLNPVGSGVNLEILQGWVCHISGTPQLGPWMWCGAVQGVSITAAEATAIKTATRDPSAVPRAKAWSQTALTGGIVHINVKPFVSSQFVAAIAATTDGLEMVDNVDGAIVVLPGGMITLAPTTAITGPPNLIAAAGILYAEIPRALREIL